jgi:tRNA-splicing ligase RtcB
MFELRGKFNSAKIFTDNVEVSAQSQIMELLNQEFIKNSKIRIMPDVHAGAGCTIGTTMTIQDKIVPNLVGVDIGCGMLVYMLGNKDINLEQLDNFIRKNIPSGHNFNEKIIYNSISKDLEKLRCYKHLRNSGQLFEKSIGSLGGGNHFIEVDIDNDGNKYLIVHSGSRNLGKQVCEYYQKVAYDKLTQLDAGYAQAVKDLTNEYIKSGKQKQISDAIIALRKKYKKEVKINRDLAYVEGEDFDNYLHDMRIVQYYAHINRFIMLQIIVKNLSISPFDLFETVHNYIGFGDDTILRKGAISALNGERVLIPMNMADGCIIGIGKGNEDWNCSAPHGAGRILSRAQARQQIDVGDFKKAMEGVYTTSVSYNTVDESPMAYKPMQEILDNIGDTIAVEKIIKPIYNFKASEE